MSERIPYMEGDSFSDERQNSDFVQHTIELERELMKMRRTEKVLQEIEQRYLAFMDSAVFLFLILDPDGTFRMMNHRAEEFFGFQLKLGVEVTLQSLSGPGYAREVESILKDALEKPIHATVPVVRNDGTLGWLDMEFFCSIYQGEPSIQVVSSDITDFMKGKNNEVVSASSSSQEHESTAAAYALQILNSCPGLLCFAVDKENTLLYSTRGYREVARRFLGHECRTGSSYPTGLETPFDLELQELIQEAFLGNTTLSSLVEKNSEGNNRWSVTAAPIASSPGEIVGAIVNLTAEKYTAAPVPPTPADEYRKGADEPKAASPTSMPVTSEGSQRELLDAIPKMLFVVSGEGHCIEANACFLSTLKLNRDEVVGHAFPDLTLSGDPINEQMPERFLLALKNGFSEELECRIGTKEGEILTLGLSGSRLQWKGEPAMLAACTDHTKLRRTEEQLKRLSITDTSTGIPNRHGMERILNAEIERNARYRGPLSLILLNVGGFMALNGRIGVASSEQVFCELTTAIKSRTRLTDFLGRWGSDEFVILTPLPLAKALQLSEKLQDMVQNRTFGEGHQFVLSIGVAEFQKSMDVSAFVESAYDAMGKQEGGNDTVGALEEAEDEGSMITQETQEPEE